MFFMRNIINSRAFLGFEFLTTVIMEITVLSVEVEEVRPACIFKLKNNLNKIPPHSCWFLSWLTLRL
jgi:hypothetical protein